MPSLNLKEHSDNILRYASDPEALCNYFQDIIDNIKLERKAKYVASLIEKTDKKFFFIDPSIPEKAFSMIKTKVDGGCFIPFTIQATARKYEEKLQDGIIDTKWYIRISKEDLIQTVSKFQSVNQDNIEHMFISENIDPSWIENPKMTNCGDTKFFSIIRSRCNLIVKCYLYVK